jgi:phage protein D
LLSHCVVRLDGDELAPEIAARLVQVRVRDSLRLPDQAFLRFADPLLQQVDQGLLTVGRELEVLSAGPDGAAPARVFNGTIQSIELELVGEGAFIAATAYEPAFALHQNRRTRVFQEMTPSDIAEEVIAAVGLTSAVESSGGTPYPFLLQNDETDWQLLWRLAGAIDFEVVGKDKTVHFRPAGSTGTGAPLTLRAPDELLSFRPRVSGAQQVESVVVRGWDPSSAEAIVSTQSPPSPDSTP